MKIKHIIYILQDESVEYDALLEVTVFFVAKFIQPSKINA